MPLGSSRQKIESRAEKGTVLFWELDSDESDVDRSDSSDECDNVPVNSKTAHAPPLPRGKPRGIWLLSRSLLDIDFVIKTNDKKSRRFDPSEVIFKWE